MKQTRSRGFNLICSLLSWIGVFNFVNATPVFADNRSVEETENTRSMDVVQTAMKAGQFTILTKAIQITGLENTLKGEGPFTVFAPTDEAFRKIPEDQLNALLQKPELLKKVLLNHVIEGSWSVEDLKSEDSLPSIEGSTLKITVLEDGKIKINQADIKKSDIAARNGMIHVIDTVLIP